MGIESVIICIDNSEWMRNGDFVPTRLQAQQDAVNVVARYKVRDNPETTVGLLTLADSSVRVPLTTDVAKVVKSLQSLEPRGKIKFITGIRIAHLALKHRQNKNHKMKIVAFVASPIQDELKEVERLAKRLKKEKVHIDVISFGEEQNENKDKLKAFIDTLNGKEPKDKCHLVQAAPGPLLSDVLMGSPILMGEDGASIAVGHGGFEFGIDPMAADDPELAMALRVSLEEQRQRQEEEARRVQQESLEQMQTEQATVTGKDDGGLAQAEAAELPYNPEMPSGNVPNISAMTEEEQLALALRMSMAAVADSVLPELTSKEGGEEEVMETSSDGEQGTGIAGEAEGEEGDVQMLDDDEMKELMGNREYLESVLSSLPGVNPEEALHNLEEMRQAAQQQEEEETEKDTDKEHTKS